MTSPSRNSPSRNSPSRNSPSWNPVQYLTFDAERARPFDDLVARIPTVAPESVVDLGCGPGNVTRTLLDRWPAARVHGIDSSQKMIDAANAVAADMAAAGDDRLTFTLADVETWASDRPVDVIIANAVLHWIPDHVDLLPGWIESLTPGGTLAFQVPANADSRAAEVLRAVAGSPRWAPAFAAVSRSGGLSKDTTTVRAAAEYADILGLLGCVVDAWQTTYVHILPGDDPVLEWYAGSGLRPYTDALDPADVAEFRADVATELRVAYPRRPYGTPLPFRRVFVVARASPPTR